MVEVGAAVAEVLDAAVVVEFDEVDEIDVGDEGHFGVGGGLGLDGIDGKSEVAGGEDGGLSVLDVHVVDAGEVANASRDHDVAFVFDGAGAGAVSDAVVAVLGVGLKGDKEDLHSFLSHEAREFGEFDVVADENADFSGIGGEDGDFVAADHPEA